MSWPLTLMLLVTNFANTIYRNFARIRHTFLHEFLLSIRGCVLYTKLEIRVSNIERPGHTEITNRWPAISATRIRIEARTWFHFNCVSNMFSTSLTVQLLFVISDLSSRFYLKHNYYNTLHECPSPYNNQRNVCPNPMLVSKMTPISFICI